MPRPTDWDKVGLGADPTPGDPARIDEVITSLRNLGTVAREVDTALAAVLDTAGPEAFAGKTAEALREKISGRLRGFVQSLAEAFEWSTTALTTYVAVMRDEQWRADQALTQARGMAEDDPGRQALTDTARTAGEHQRTAADSASSRIVEAYQNIKQPVSGCEEFWEIFKWIAIALILPALVFGGPIALVAIGVNLALFIKTAVDFAHGNATALEFFLSALGILAPTTRAVPIFQLIAAGAKFAWAGIKAGAFAVFKFFGNAFRGIISHPFVLFPSLHDIATVAGTWVRNGALWVRNGITDLPGLAGIALSKTGLFIVNGVKGIQAFATGIPSMVAKFGTSTWQFLKTEFGGNRWLRLFLPAEADELHLGVWKAMKLAVVDRGIMGNHLYGLPRPHVFVPESGGGGVHLDLNDVRTGNLAVPPRIETAHVGSFEGLGRITPTPPTLQLHSTIGDGFHFSADAVRTIDTIMLSPVDTLSRLRLEGLTSGAPVLHTVDPGTGVSAGVHLQPVSPAQHAGAGSNLHLPGISAVTAPPPGTLLGGIHLGETGSMAGAVHLTPPGAITHSAVPPASVLATAVPPPTAVTHLGASPVLANAVPPPAGLTHAGAAPVVVANAAPPPAGLTHGGPAPVTLGDLGPAGLPAVHNGFTTATHLGTPPPSVHAGAMDLLAQHPGAAPAAHTLIGAPGGAVNGAGARIGDHTGLAIGAQHVTQDLGTLGRNLDTPPVSQLVVTRLDGVSAHAGPTGPGVTPAHLAGAPPALHGTTVQALHATPTPMPHGGATSELTGLSAGGGALGRGLDVPPGTGRGLDVPPGGGAGRGLDVPPGGGAGHGLDVPPGAAMHGPPPGVSTNPAHLAGTPGGGGTHLGAPRNLTPDELIAPQPVTVHMPDTRALNGSGTRIADHTGLADSARHAAPPPALGPVGRTGEDIGAGAPPPPGGAADAGVDPVTVTLALGLLQTQIGRGAPHAGSAAVRDVATTPPPPASGRPTGAQLDAAWQRDSNRIAGLFGALDDPLRRQRLDAWGSYTAARNELGRVEAMWDDIRARPGQSSSGPGLAHVHAERTHQAALTKVARLETDLRGLGVNPAAMDARISELTAGSLRDRPRMLGGGQNLSQMINDLWAGAPIDGHVVLRGADGGGLGLRVEELADGAGAVQLRLLDDDGAVVVNRTVTEHDGGYQISDGTGFQRFDADGDLTEVGTILRGLDGHDLDGRFVVEPTGGYAAGGVRIESTGGHAITQHGNGFQVADGAGFHRFDAAGAATAAGRPLRDATGAPIGGQFVVTHGAGGTVVEVADPRFTVAAHGGGGFQVTDTLGHHAFQRFDGTGALTETGRPLRDAGGGVLGDRFLVTPTGGAPTRIEVTDARYTVAAHGAGFQITDTAAHHAFQRFDGAGALTATGRPLTDAGGGVLGNRFFVTDAHGAGGRIEVTDARFTVAAHGGGFQITDTAAHHAFQRFDNAGTLTATGRPLTDAGGGVLGNRFFVTDAHGGRIEVTDARFTVAAHGGGTQITDTAAGNAFQRFDGTGAHIETGTPAHNLAGQADRVVVNPAAGGAGHVESLTGVRLHGWQVAPDGAGYRITDQLGLHTGEFRRYDAAGNLLEQSFNVLRDAAPTTRQFVVDAAGRTWRLHDNGLPTPATGAFHAGTLDAAAAGTGRVRLLNRTGVEVFDRRPIPGGTTLDVFRRIDGDFGRTSQRPQWVQLTADGRVVDHGVRRFDTNAVGWRDVNHNGRLVHEIRQGIGGGDVVGLRGALGDWTWHRFDNAGNRLGHGPRALDRDGGWTDRLPPVGGNPGPVVQRQWGTAHAPANAGMYQQFDLGAGGVRRDTWQAQSPHGKDAGKLESLPTGDRLETRRWSEQRPPQWARKFLAGVDEDVFRANPHLRTDTRFQLFEWRRLDQHGNVRAQGFRFVSMNDSTYDFNNTGRFVRSSAKLDHGNTLKVGHDVVDLPPAAVRDANRIPWSEGNGRLSGHRVNVGPHPDGRIWEDRFVVGQQHGNWYEFGGQQHSVARAGYADGSIKEFHRPPAPGAADGGIASRGAAHEGTGVWVRKDPHGVIIGRADDWPDPAGGVHRVEANAPDRAGNWSWSGYDARSDSRTWQWRDGAGQTGSREYGRGFNGPHTTYDDSFRDTVRGADGHQVLIRERRMLDSGGHVDSWRVDLPGGGHEWHWRKVDRYGNVAAAPGANPLRRWWDTNANGGAGGWVADWFGGATRFRDEVTDGAGAAVTVREIPAGAEIGRIREYNLGTPGAWREFDMGTTVRERSQIPGGFLERDAWRGQWRQYDNTGLTIARRTDDGYVFERANGAWESVGRELDYRGGVTELRGWNRRIREANRMEWGGELRLGTHTEALYEPYWKLALQKAALEFTQEFLLEFAANLAVNGIVDAIAGTEFNGKDVLKAFANAAVGAAVKQAVGSLVHDNKFGAMQRSGDWKAGLANIDGGKGWHRKPLNHDKHWSNEWAGNETATRWRGGTYDFAFNVPVAGLTGFVNGSMNAAVFGITNANGETVYLTGGAAAFDGLLSAAAGVTGAVTTSIAKTLFNSGLGGRAFHRQGLAEFAFQLPWKIIEKTVTSQLLKEFRMHDNPWYYAK
ncbi:hypothetical protein ACFO1B_33800 [Dactylosporangium siamense]|uniref:Uncharacterized protein n=1 Tax=Dactylosporangium siamense TaxID=685454 RepID=A0A919U988_9ACTN|nr:hypothetical protein [Dactylosporangium siamense]GIG42418.1 hypothetical protein Dsi01nite_004590 [Dactylosporangium siamense]